MYILWPVYMAYYPYKIFNKLYKNNERFWVINGPEQKIDKFGSIDSAFDFAIKISKNYKEPIFIQDTATFRLRKKKPWEGQGYIWDLNTYLLTASGKIIKNL
jgi:hypothetical protein